MKNSDKGFVLGAVAICLIIALLSPFIASSNPDGLDKSAQNLGVKETNSTSHSPFQDYHIPGLGKIGGILALVIGILVTFTLAWIMSIILKRKKPP